MSINRDMKNYELQHNEPIRTASGATKNIWVKKGTIQVSVRKKNDMKVLTSEKYLECTHTGLTYCKTIDTDSRLVGSGIEYEVLDCNTESRLTNLILKEVR